MEKPKIVRIADLKFKEDATDGLIWSGRLHWTDGVVTGAAGGVDIRSASDLDLANLDSAIFARAQIVAPNCVKVSIGRRKATEQGARFSRRARMNLRRPEL